VDVNPAAVGWHRAAGETKRGERMVVHATGPTDQVGVSEVKAAAKQGGIPEYGTDAMHALGREAKRGQRIPEEDLKLAELDDLSGKPDDAASPTSIEAPTILETGPGALKWDSITDSGVPGFAARWRKGTFKLLQVAGETYGLFYEHDGGKGYEMIVCDQLERAKRAAGERMKAIPGAQLIHVVCRQTAREDEAAAFLDAFSLPGFVAETRKRALGFELAILQEDTEEVVATVTMNDELPVVITWNDDELEGATAEAIKNEVNRVLTNANANADADAPAVKPRADKPRLSIRYSIAGETTSGPLVNVTLLLHMGASDPVLFQRDGVQLYGQNTNTLPENFLESVFQDVIDEEDVKLSRRLGQFLGHVLPSEKFKPADLELSERDEGRSLAGDLVVALLVEDVRIDINVPEANEAASVRPAKAPANADAPRTAPQVRRKAGTAERAGRRTRTQPAPASTPAAPADDSPEAMDKELMTSFTTELDNVLAEDD